MADSTGPDLPYTSRAKKVLELAMAEARRLEHTYVGTEHLLLGLLREEKGIAAQVLADAGITIENAGNEILRILANQPAPAPGESASRGQRGIWPRRRRGTSGSRCPTQRAPLSLERLRRPAGGTRRVRRRRICCQRSSSRSMKSPRHLRRAASTSKP